MSNKKIGCVVIMHPGQNNYGSSLQGFATIEAISKLGYDCEIIRYNKVRNLRQTLKDLPGYLQSGAIGQQMYLYHKKWDLFAHKEFARTRKMRTAAVDRFKKKYLDAISAYYTGYEALQKGSLKYSVIMVGSDQVWGPLSLYSRFYNLLFVDDSVPKFSYASSFGVSNIIPCQREAVKGYLQRLDKIGLREQRGKEIVEELTDRKDAQVVLDPTLLLDRATWESHIDESRCKVDEPYILTYLLGERADIRKQVRKLRKESGIKVVNLPHIDNYHKIDDDLGDINLYDVDPFDFIRLVRDAKYVVTDSFHGSVFSILFHKKFMTFYRKPKTAKGNTNSRIDSLFNIFGQSDRLFHGDIFTEIDKDVDWAYVEQQLSGMKVQSLDFLKSCLALAK